MGWLLGAAMMPWATASRSISLEKTPGRVPPFQAMGAWSVLGLAVNEVRTLSYR